MGVRLPPFAPFFSSNSMLDSQIQGQSLTLSALFRLTAYIEYCIEQRLRVCDSWNIPIAWDIRYLVPSRRLEDRIRELCAKAVADDDPADFNEIMQKLRESLREHANRLRELAARKLRPKGRDCA